MRASCEHSSLAINYHRYHAGQTECLVTAHSFLEGLALRYLLKLAHDKFPLRGLLVHEEGHCKEKLEKDG